MYVIFHSTRSIKNLPATVSEKFFDVGIISSVFLFLFAAVALDFTVDCIESVFHRIQNGV